MTKVRLLVAVVALALCACVSAQADVYVWDISEWDCTNNPVNPDVPCFVFDYDWEAGVGGVDLLTLCGPAPSPNDPDVSQTIRNRTQVQWTDWHVDITNGAIVEGSAIAYNVNASDPAWVIDYIDDNNDGLYEGLFAHVVSGMDTQIDTMESLYLFFSYDVIDPGSDVDIKQYPTNDFPIPEPASMFAMLAGLAGLLGIRRRSK